MNIKTFIEELQKINIVPSEKNLSDLETYKNRLLEILEDIGKKDE